MKMLRLIACLLLPLAQLALALVCPTTPPYNASITTLCAEKDMDVLWPNYEDVTQYYICLLVGYPILEDCFPNTIFDFSKQKCTECSDYIAAPSCQALKGKNCKSFKPVKAPAPTATTATPCFGVTSYNTTFKPVCKGRDLYMFYPNYKNESEFYCCQGPYNPKILYCPSGTRFDYYKQLCTDCATYVVAAPPCEKLPFDKSNKCIKL